MHDPLAKGFPNLLSQIILPKMAKDIKGEMGCMAVLPMLCYHMPCGRLKLSLSGALAS